MIDRLERGWRVVATGCCFAVFGGGALVLAITAVPAIYLIAWPAERRYRWGQRLLARAFGFFVGIMRATGVLTVSVEGRERLQQGGRVVVANHPSLIDVVLLISLMPRTVCIVKASLWRNPVTGLPLRLAGFIPNSSGPEVIAHCCKALADGASVLVFPEGTRTRPGQPLAMQRGAANIAVHAAADVLPVTISLSETTLTKGQPWYHVPRERLHVSLWVDEPIAVDPFIERCASKPLAARELTAHFERYYRDQLAALDRLPERQQPLSLATH